MNIPVDDDAWLQAPEWQARVADADADRRAGNFVRYDSTEDFLAALADEPDDGSPHVVEAARLAANSAYVAEVRAAREQLDELRTW